MNDLRHATVQMCAQRSAATHASARPRPRRRIGVADQRPQGVVRHKGHAGEGQACHGRAMWARGISREPLLDGGALVRVDGERHRFVCRACDEVAVARVLSGAQCGSQRSAAGSALHSVARRLRRGRAGRRGLVPRVGGAQDESLARCGFGSNDPKTRFSAPYAGTHRITAPEGRSTGSALPIGQKRASTAAQRGEQHVRQRDKTQAGETLQDPYQHSEQISETPNGAFI